MVIGLYPGHRRFLHKILLAFFFTSDKTIGPMAMRGEAAQLFLDQYRTHC